MTDSDWQTARHLIKQPQIIRLLLAGTLLVTGARTTLAQSPTPLACVSCLVLEVSASAAAVNSVAPPAGVTLLVRTSDAARGARLARQLAECGAEAGVLLEAESATSVFALRTSITMLRAQSPGLRIALDAESLAGAGIALDAVAAYADTVVAVDGGPGRWRRLAAVSTPSVDDLSSASFAAGGERVVLPVDRLEDRKSTRLNSSHVSESRMPSSA